MDMELTGKHDGIKWLAANGMDADRPPRTSPNGQIAVRRRDRTETFLANPVNVGVESRLSGTGIQGLWREKNFQLLEDEFERILEGNGVIRRRQEYC